MIASKGRNFVTLAMDAMTGATEAFQLSDVSVQMVSEGLLFTRSTSDDDNDETKHATPNTPFSSMVKRQNCWMYGYAFAQSQGTLFCHTVVGGASIPPPNTTSTNSD
jgi:hypothetical protein